MSRAGDMSCKPEMQRCKSASCDLSSPADILQISWFLFGAGLRKLQRSAVFRAAELSQHFTGSNVSAVEEICGFL
ncbi:hypothetical protein KUCAC02_033024 [Chaenocephalus aceratus]|nr:hypothetical protein KUCAC02_033024 [Chaenocephalus aceratus]